MDCCQCGADMLRCRGCDDCGLWDHYICVECPNELVRNG